MFCLVVITWVLFDIKHPTHALKGDHKGNGNIVALPKSSCGCTSSFKRSLKDSPSTVLQARRKLGAIATNEYHSVLEVNENPSL